MLTLTRKIGEAIIIAGNIKILIKDVKGNQVRVGIEAPREVPVYREELYQQILEENRQAAGSFPTEPTSLDSFKPTVAQSLRSSKHSDGERKSASITVLQVGSLASSDIPVVMRKKSKSEEEDDGGKV